MTDLIKELEALRDGLNERRKTGWGPSLKALDDENLTEGLMNLIGTLITAYSAEDEMHAVQDDTPAVERGEPFNEAVISDPDTSRITVAALAELARAKTKWPLWPVDPVHAFAVVAEEVGEAQREVIKAVYERKPGQLDQSVVAVREECVQSMAMLYRFMMALETGHYEWSGSAQFED